MIEAAQWKADLPRGGAVGCGCGRAASAAVPGAMEEDGRPQPIGPVDQWEATLHPRRVSSCRVRWAEAPPARCVHGRDVGAVVDEHHRTVALAALDGRHQYRVPCRIAAVDRGRRCGAQQLPQLVRAAAWADHLAVQLVVLDVAVPLHVGGHVPAAALCLGFGATRPRPPR